MLIPASRHFLVIWALKGRLESMLYSICFLSAISRGVNLSNFYLENLSLIDIFCNEDEFSLDGIWYSVGP